MIGYPEKRLGWTLSQGDIDVIMASESLCGQFEDQIISTKYPYSVIIWFIYYDSRKGWHPIWPPDTIFLNKHGTSFQSSSSLKQQFNLNISQTPSFHSSVKIVNGGHADYWIENMGGIRSLSPGLLKNDSEGFIYRTIFRRRIYFFFQNSERCRELRDALDSGFEKTLRESLFVKVFYGNDDSFTNTLSSNETITLLKNEYPNLRISEQQPP